MLFMKNKKGVAGLNVLLSLITMLFMIGLVIMVFTISGSRLKASLSDDTEAQDVINTTYHSLSDTVDWFPTFIVLGALVVLVLLAVIIIRSVKGSGLTEGA
jgi:hypothetical protein